MTDLYCWLETANCAHLYDTLDRHCVTSDNFLELGPSDWNAFQITNPSDKMKLMSCQKTVRYILDNGDDVALSKISSGSKSQSTRPSVQPQHNVVRPLYQQNNTVQQSQRMSVAPTQQPVQQFNQQNIANIKSRATAVQQQHSTNNSNNGISYVNDNQTMRPSTISPSPSAPLSRQPSTDVTQHNKQNNNEQNELQYQMNSMNIHGNKHNNSNKSQAQSYQADDEYVDEGLIETDGAIDVDELVDDDVDGVIDDSSDGFNSKGELAVDGWVTYSKIRVAVRKRPLFSSEKKRNELDIAFVKNESSCLVVHEPKQKVDLTKFVECHEFTFDEVFDENSTNEQIYTQCCRPLVAFFLNKGKATCFAYGQTGSGKTFTMMGPGGGKSENNGLYVLAARDIYRYIREVPAYSSLQVYVSFFEIYGGKLYDLLNKREKLVARQDGNGNVQVVGLAEKLSSSTDELLTLITDGNSSRSTGSTGANADSSRSHAILQIVVKKMVKDVNGKSKLKVHGKFSFIDLAGSERAADTTNNNQQTRLEGAEINKSLLALKECIRALDMESKHLPFRGSQLTQVLKDSFIGNSRTVMLANVSPNSGSCEHTLNTLRYADRVKELKRGEGGKLTGGVKDNNTVNAYMPHKELKKPVKRYAGDVDGELDPHNDQDENKQQIITPSVHNNMNSNVSNNKQSNQQSGKPTVKQVQQNKSQPTLSKYNEDEYNDAGDNDGLNHSQQYIMQSNLLEQQSDIVQAHRSEIDATMQLVRREMESLKNYDLNSCNVLEYVDAVDSILEERLSTVHTFRNKLNIFKNNLLAEELESSRQFTSPPVNTTQPPQQKRYR